MPVQNMVEAIRDVLKMNLKDKSNFMVLGEDVGRSGGVFRVTEGLQSEFGEERVVDTPLSEAGILGAAVGLCANGMRVSPEIQFMAFGYPALEQIVSHVARFRQRSRGRYHLPMVIRIPYGGRIRAPELHSDSTEAFFTHVPGLTVVSPSTPKDAKGLLAAALRSEDPVVFLEPIRLYRLDREEVPDGWYEIPLSSARVAREGKDLTVITWGGLVRDVLIAAEKWAEERGVDIEVIDLRTLSPWDEETVFTSVKKTKRAVIVHEAWTQSGFGAEISSRIHEECMLHLESPVYRVGAYDVPTPLFSLEDFQVPFAARIDSGIAKSLEF